MVVPRPGSTCFSSINCGVQSLHSFSSSASGTSFSGIFRPYHFRRLFAWSSMLASQHDCLRNTQASSVCFECCSVDFPEESSLFVLHLVRAQVISVLVFPAAFCMPVRSILPTRLFPPLQVSDPTCLLRHSVCLLETCQIVLSLHRVSLFFALSFISCSTCFITCMA